MIVTLTEHEIAFALEVFKQRLTMNIMVGAKHKYGAGGGPAADAALDIVGTRGELAVAKALNLFWSGNVGDYKAIDVGGLFEVRAVEDPSRRLIIHDEDKDEPPFILAIQHEPTRWELRGWVHGHEAKRPEFFKDPTGKGRHAYFVAHAFLRPMKELVALYGLHAIVSAESREPVTSDGFL